MILPDGTRVVTREQRAGGHTRLPFYLQKKPGVVATFLGTFPLPDDNARDSKTARRSRLYTVTFNAADVFGPGARGRICADLFEEYFEAAT